MFLYPNELMYTSYFARWVHQLGFLLASTTQARHQWFSQWTYIAHLGNMQDSPGLTWWLHLFSFCLKYVTLSFRAVRRCSQPQEKCWGKDSARQMSSFTKFPKLHFTILELQEVPVVKNPYANAADTRDAVSMGGEGPCRGNRPTPVFPPGNHGQRSLVGYRPLGSKGSDTTTPPRMHAWFLLIFHWLEQSHMVIPSFIQASGKVILLENIWRLLIRKKEKGYWDGNSLATKIV